ncbi:hypothetical protein HK105_208791 [Polyrhizophydium stewartii]|uniref:Uncharacterized protein n=1 Tax=Polyrhizophydium stewartii TaxID=2732419 RepID=A0ABR4MWY7_9FUNG
MAGSGDAAEPLSPLAEGLIGAISSVVANAIVYPLDVVTTRLQVQTQLHTTLGAEAGPVVGGRPLGDDGFLAQAEMLRTVAQEEGLQGLYAGVKASLSHNFASNLAYFMFYSAFREAAVRRAARIAARDGGSSTLSIGAELLLAAAAGACSRTVTTPISVAATRRQAAGQAGQMAGDADDAAKGGARPRQATYGETVRAIVGSGGVAALWSGLGPSLVLTVNPAITYGLFERLKAGLLGGRGRTQLTAGEAFLLGALTKALATVATYPLIVAKVLLQSGAPAGERAYAGAADCLRRAAARGGAAALFRGLRAQIGKATLCQALLLAVRAAIARRARRAWARPR